WAFSLRFGGLVGPGCPGRCTRRSCTREGDRRGSLFSCPTGQSSKPLLYPSRRSLGRVDRAWSCLCAAHSSALLTCRRSLSLFPGTGFRRVDECGGSRDPGLWIVDLGDIRRRVHRTGGWTVLTYCNLSGLPCPYAPRLECVRCDERHCINQSADPVVGRYI